MKFVIIGIHKCGTTSLEKYFKSQGHEVVRDETAFELMTPIQVEAKYPDHHPIIILRDPVARLWSHFHYKRKPNARTWPIKPRWTLEEALDRDPYLVRHSCYHLFIEKFRKLQPIVLTLETLAHEPTFPWENGTDYAELPDELRTLISKKIQEYGDTHVS